MDNEELKTLKLLAEKIAPDYPNIKTVGPFELLWAIESAYEGTELANKDCHEYIKKLSKCLFDLVGNNCECDTSMEKETGDYPIAVAEKYNKKPNRFGEYYWGDEQCQYCNAVDLLKSFYIK